MLTFRVTIYLDTVVDAEGCSALQQEHGFSLRIVSVQRLPLAGLRGLHGEQRSQNDNNTLSPVVPDLVWAPEQKELRWRKYC
jgi:hypothetical protein